jgi:glycerol-3-phosphate acyltransferase PlsY
VTAAVLLAAYLLGGISFGLIASRAIDGTDPRRHGSGNIGFTNVLRVGGKGAAAVTLIGDLGKGGAAVWLARRAGLTEAGVLAAGALVTLGHIAPLFLAFRGGKGVATGLGVLLVLDPAVGVTTAALWLGTVLVTRISSLGAIVAFATLPLTTAAFGRSGVQQLFALGLALLVLARHRSNIERLWRREEPQIGR